MSTPIPIPGGERGFASAVGAAARPTAATVTTTADGSKPRENREEWENRMKITFYGSKQSDRPVWIHKTDRRVEMVHRTATRSAEVPLNCVSKATNAPTGAPTWAGGRR
ncbi:hypothetical protein NCAST_19_00020 [Nocardia asteroides NBRC 15531]|uniref:Uncharacterized protein n=1 Tax=Nocardia asteroides NBRC 15531 TaxID=1110697 RepID=U5E7M5_NOCAS|nr:hypothetical protein NCAST_19_00020 [Nocardia asteroides NBRC 15531]